jgi:tRNA threonylcarbamoyladenosine biosynthesis protein TsaB
VNALVDLLAVHTTDAAGSIAVARGSQVTSVEFEAAGQHAPVVLATIVELLERAGVAPRDLDGVAVTTGPGSFTGIRVGLATVQGLAAACGWRVHACDSLRARAAVWCGRVEEPLAVVLDARRGEVYAGLYDATGTSPRVLVEPFCDAPVRAGARLAEGMARSGATAPAQAVLALCGTGASLVEPELRALRCRVLDGQPRPVAEALVGLARDGALAAVTPQALEPTYLRKSDAEVRRDTLRGSQP